MSTFGRQAILLESELSAESLRAVLQKKLSAPPARMVDRSVWLHVRGELSR